MSILNLTNYRDKNYCYVVLTCLISMILIGDILTPILNYSVISLPKNYPLLNYYIMAASVAPSLPFMLSIFISFAVNNFRYKVIIITCFSLSSIIAIVILVFSVNNFLLLTGCIIFISFLFRALYFSLDKQLSSLLITKIKDFQSDSFILSSILGAINYKFSAYIYTNYKLPGIIIVFLIGSCILCYCASQIDAVNELEEISNELKPRLTLKIISAYKIIVNHTSLLRFIIIMLIIMLLGGSFNILLMTKIHSEQIGIPYYSDLISLSMSLGIFSALFCKFNWLNRFHHCSIMGVSILLSGICIIGLGISDNLRLFAIFYLIYSFIDNIILIHMKCYFFWKISLSKDLIAISPFLNGLMATLFYCVSLIGQVIITQLLAGQQLNYHSIFFLIGSMNLILAFSIFILKKPMNIHTAY